MGKNVNPFSLRRDPFGFVEGPKYAIDKIMSYVFYHVKCPKCGDIVLKKKTCKMHLIMLK